VLTASGFTTTQLASAMSTVGKRLDAMGDAEIFAKVVESVQLQGKAMELMMTADMIGAEEARSLGLVNHVFPLADLLTKTKEILTKIQTKAPLAIGHIIALVNQAAKCDPAGFNNEIEAFGDCFDSEDKKEGTDAFLEKRKPVFKGK
jgi:enoyl-CoA hydratase